LSRSWYRAIQKEEKKLTKSMQFLSPVRLSAEAVFWFGVDPVRNSAKPHLLKSSKAKPPIGLMLSRLQISIKISKRG